MLSFGNALIRNNDVDSQEYFEPYPNIGSNKFVDIGVIDPSLFHKDDNLLDIVISKMFALFQREIQKGNFQEDYETKRKLIQQFQKVYNNLKTIYDKRRLYEREDIDALADLAFGSGLKNNLCQLFHGFIAFISGSKEGFLVLIIDDLDLKIKGTYEMLEDIRKYLITKQVIIFLACKIEQLRDSLEEAIRDDYPNILRSENSRLNELPLKTADNYLNKLIPKDRRLYLPELKIIHKASNYEIKFLNSKNWLKGKVFRNKTIEEIIFETIYKNTRLFIYRSVYYIHPIVPFTLRSLVNDIKVYDDLNESDYSLEKLNNHFIDSSYFGIKEFELWNKPKSLDVRSNYSDFISKIDTFLPENLNQRIIAFLDYNNFFDEKLAENSYKFLVVKDEKGSNISVGDLMYIFKKIEKSLNVYELIKLRIIKGLRVFYNIHVLKSINNGVSPRAFLGGSLLCKNYWNNYLRKDRDVFKFTIHNVEMELGNNQVTHEDWLWLSLFLSFIGKQEKGFKKHGKAPYYTNNYSDPFSKNRIGLIKEATFSFLDFILNSIDYEKSLARFQSRHKKDSIRHFELYHHLEKWNKENEIINRLFFNIDFLSELIDKISDLSINYKEALPSNYSGILWKYLHGRLDRAIREIFNKYDISYNNFNSNVGLFSNHPVLTYWRKNRDRVDLLLDTVWKHRIIDGNEKRMAQEFLNKVIHFYLEKPSRIGNSERGVKSSFTRQMNKFVKFEKIYAELRTIRSLMDEDILDGLKLAKEYLQNIANG